MGHPPEAEGNYFHPSIPTKVLQPFWSDLSHRPALNQWLWPEGGNAPFSLKWAELDPGTQHGVSLLPGGGWHGGERSMLKNQGSLEREGREMAARKITHDTHASCLVWVSGSQIVSNPQMSLRSAWVSTSLFFFFFLVLLFLLLYSIPLCGQITFYHFPSWEMIKFGLFPLFVCCK